MPTRADRHLLLVAAVVFLLAGNDPVYAQHGCDPGNLIPNCNFDTFGGSPPRQVPSGWSPYVISGDLSFEQQSDTTWGAPSLQMWSDGGVFVAGIYTQVGGLQPGVAYKASIGWGAPTAPNAFGRRLGIDPYGGTDPNAASVVWGPMHRGDGRILNYATDGPNVDVSAVAQASTVTVFVYVDHNYSTGVDLIFIDAVGLYVDPVQPTPAPTAAPTSTPLPPATWTAMPSATWTSTSTVQPSPTWTLTPTETLTPTATWTPEPTATFSPTTTTTLFPRATVTPQSSATRTSGEPPRGMLWGGLGSLTGAAILAGALLRQRRS